MTPLLTLWTQLPNREADAIFAQHVCGFEWFPCIDPVVGRESRALMLRRSSLSKGADMALPRHCAWSLTVPAYTSEDSPRSLLNDAYSDVLDRVGPALLSERFHGLYVTLGGKRLLTASEISLTLLEAVLGEDEYGEWKARKVIEEALNRND